jgi:hypothetical protein
VKLLLAILVAQASSPEAPSRADAVAVLRVVLAGEAQERGATDEGRRICVRMDVAEGEFGRSHRARARRPTRPPPPPPRGALAVLDPREVALTYSGGDLAYWDPAAPDAARLVPAAEVAAIRALMDRTFERPPQPRRIRRLPRTALPRAFVPCGSRRDRTPRFELTEPELAGDVAFVTIGYQCGALCGEGRRFVVKRARGRWRIEAVETTWVS